MDKNSEASAEHRKELLEFFQSTLEEIRQDFMAAAAKPVCYIPCPLCPSLHIKLTNFLKGGVQLCKTESISQDHYQDLCNNTKGMSTYCSNFNIKYVLNIIHAGISRIEQVKGKLDDFIYVKFVVIHRTMLASHFIISLPITVLI